MGNIDFRKDILPLKDKLFKFALRITLDSVEAEDIVQETLMKIWDRRERWEEIESIDAFCMTICRNLALDKVKSPRHRLRESMSAQEEAGAAIRTEPVSDSPTPEEKTVLRDRIRLIRRVMDTLPEKQRTAMYLRDFQARPYKEIAEVMGISEEQVKVNIYRARQAIKKKFVEDDRYGL